jgi:hypothetical protein
VKYKIATGVGVVALVIAASAQAQVYPPPSYAAPPVGYGDGLPPREILMLVRAQGLRPLTQPARRGPRYVLLASDHAGGQFHVFVSAYNGRVLRVIPGYDGGRFAYNPGRPPALIPSQPGAVPSERYGAMPAPNAPPVPPSARAAPPPGGADMPRVASTPDGASPAPQSRPTRTPLPRPRPSTAAKETQPATAQAAPMEAPTGTIAQQPEQKAAPAPKAAPSAPTQMVPVVPLD